RFMFLGILFLLLAHNGIAQSSKKEYVVSGTIRDHESQELLIGVTIVEQGNESKGTITNVDGEYKIKVFPGEVILIISYIGYDKEEIKLRINADITQDIFLKPSSLSLQEVVVSGRKADENVTNVQSGVEKISIKEINTLPVLLGEKDIIKSIQLLPGVRSTGEGSSGIYVRGGSSDQNSILLDNIPLYNTSHLMGFFSTFNSDVIKNATLYKGAMPAQFGERLSSVIDIQSMDGDMEKYNFNGGVGLISSKLSIDGPIQKGKSSFVIAGRRTYADLVAKAIGAEDAKSTSLYFYDLNMKMNFNLSDKDRLIVSGYWGRDVVGMKNLFNNSYGNLSGAIRWSRNFNSKLLMNTSLIYNNYSTKAEENMDVDMKVSTDINDYIFKQDFSFFSSEKSTLRFGYSSTYHNIGPGKYRYEEKSGTDRALQNRYSWENGAYISHQLKLSEKLELLYGLRASAFSVLGKGDFYTLDQHHNVTDTTSYKSGKIVKTYFNIEPRISVNYNLNNNSSVKTSYARTTQNMHLLSNSAMNELSERWTSSSNYIKPQIADQVSLGYFRNFSDNRFEFSVEGYYKDMKNQIDFKDNANTSRKDDIEIELLFGKGRAYGVEFLLRKRTGRLTGWISYTLSKSEKKIDGINQNKWYNAIQDRTHDISVVGMYELNDKWSFSAAWVYYTGNAVSYPSGKYPVDGYEVPYFTERNGYRAPAYHRLDIEATKVLKKTKKFTSELSIGLYNAYGRENPYMIEFKTNKDDPNKLSTYQYSLFKFMPSVSWNFKF
ncbi:TonB-dependent receptor, partial [Parabacteroides sp. OttesenSCG-928-G07]|nr:TonB-dependent receptor [Parabacteroides sp. OttesenSCG-928-G07]